MGLNFQGFLTAIKFMTNTKVLDNKQHLYLAGEWLLNAQKKWGGGYAHSFSLIRGWLPAYPETTGYIIPTMLQLGEVLGEQKFSDSAKQAGNWLLSIQNQDGSFSDLSGRKQVFDTAQVAYGFLALIKEDNQQYSDSMAGALNWLINAQEPDGSWIRFAYNNKPHTYYSRVGAILVKAGDFLNNQRIRDAGRKNIDWVLCNQLENGFFEHMSFANEQPYLHTIIYTLEGLLESYSILNDRRVLDKAILTANKLVEISKRDSILRSQYGRNWEIANDEKCITGLAQWTLVCFELNKLTKKEEYLMEAGKNLQYLRPKQLLCADLNLNGALPGSVPIWGKYGRFTFLNWGVKYFIDALLRAMAIS
jgi:hypothetical protein